VLPEAVEARAVAREGEQVVRHAGDARGA
jgi:hypothetical protein